MRWSELAVRDRRAIAIGAAVLALGLGTRAGVLPYLERVRAAEERVAREEELLARERRLLREARGLRAAFDSLGTQLIAGVPRLLRGGALASTQATLSRRLEEAARAAPAQLSRVEPLPPQPAGAGLLAVPLRVEGETDYEGLLSLLAELEAGPALFHVAELDVRGREQPVPGDPTGTARTVVVAFRFTVTGFVLEGAPAPDVDSATADGVSVRTEVRP